jgi:diacylglycerol kinase family enzyme
VIARGRPLDVDLGHSTAGGFAHVLTVGVSADFAALVRDVHGWRRPWGYPQRAWRCWARRRRCLGLRVTVDGRALTIPPHTMQLAVVNSPRLGGRLGFSLPGDTMHDGVLHLLALTDRGPARWLLRQVARSVLPVSGSRHARSSEDGQVVAAGTRITIDTDQDEAVSLDGELAGTTPVRVAVRAGACTVIVGPSRHRHATSDRARHPRLDGKR